MPITDLKPALKSVIEKIPLYELLWDYYEGEQELKFSTLKLQKFFNGKGIYFAENWMGVVIDAPLDRLSLQGFSVTDATEATEKLKKAFSELSLGLVAYDLHESALVVTEAFFIVEKVGDKLDGYLQDATTCDVVYDPSNPNLKKFAIKYWYEEEGTILRVNLYYPNITERYQAQISKEASKVWEAKFEQLPSLDNPFSAIPVFHFRISQQGRVRPILDRALRSLQDAINILLSNLMIGAEFGSIRQRVIISQADPSDLGNVPGENWWIPAGDGTTQAASVQELGEFNPLGFIQMIDHLANSISAQTKTPKHYFFSHTGQIPSGEALNSMEGPLIKRTKRYLDNLEVTWRELASFLLTLAGTAQEPSEITAQWAPINTSQPKTEAETIKTSVDATIPLKTAARRAGWSAEELEQMEKDQADADKKKVTLTASILDETRRLDSQKNDLPGETNDASQE